MRGDIHNYKRKLEGSLRRLADSKIVSAKNKKLILEFHNACFAERLSIARVERYVFLLKQLAEIAKKDFERVDKKDIMYIITELEKRPYTEWTKHFYRVCLKKFYKWLRQSKDYPEEVEWLKSTVRNGGHKLPEELLNQEEVKSMIEVSVHTRNKALIAVLYESGCRIGEVASLQMKHVSFDKYGAKLIVDGKTGPRQVRIISSVPYLAAWVAEHPFKNPDSPLWPMLNKKNSASMIEYRAISKLLKEAAVKAGIRKRIYPHLFRHSRATYLAKFLTEQQLKNYLGWVAGSNMASVYVHLSGRDMDDALLKLNGVEIPECDRDKKNEALTPKPCARCSVINQATNKFCQRCGMALNLRIAMEQEEERSKADETMNKIMKIPGAKEFFEQALKEIKTGDIHA